MVVRGWRSWVIGWAGLADSLVRVLTLGYVSGLGLTRRALLSGLLAQISDMEMQEDKP